jgi:LemA protein
LLFTSFLNVYKDNIGSIYNNLFNIYFMWLLIGGGFLGLIVLIIIFAIVTYNTLIGMKNKVREAASDIDVQLKRRYDLIPNLIETVKGAGKYESETLEKVIKARQQAIDIQGINKEKAEAENMLTGALRQLFALSESYPELKANQNYLELQQELVDTEDRILASRRFYNSTVEDYNTYQDQFPAIIFKGLAGAKPADFFEITNPKERENIQVKF